MNESIKLIHILIAVFAVIAFTLMFGYPIMVMIKDHFKNRRQALNYMGEEISFDIIRKDKGAKLTYKGIMKYLDQEYRDAANLFEKALKLRLCDENREFCCNWLCNCYRLLGYNKLYKNARLQCTKALPTNDNVLMDYAWCCAEDGETEKAEEYCKRALKYNPSNNGAYRLLGFIATNTRNYSNALEYFEKALKINAFDADVLFEKAVCYAALDDYNNAREIMKQAVANDTQGKYERYRQKIEDIRKINSGDLEDPQKESSLD